MLAASWRNTSIHWAYKNKEIVKLLENVRDEIYILKNFFNKIKSILCLRLSKPTAWLAA